MLHLEEGRFTIKVQYCTIILLERDPPNRRISFASQFKKGYGFNTVKESSGRLKIKPKITYWWLTP